MKIALIALAAVFASLTAEARSMEYPYHRAELTHFRLHPSVTQNPVSTGRLSLDLNDGMMSVLMEPSFRCPPGRVCAQVMPAPIHIRLPLVKRENGACNTRIYVASEDKRPVDGTLRRLVVRDNRFNVCPHTQVLPATEVIYETVSLRGQKTRSYMSGTALTPDYDRHTEPAARAAR